MPSGDASLRANGGEFKTVATPRGAPAAARFIAGKKKGRGRRSGLFPIESQREEVLASARERREEVSLRGKFRSPERVRRP
jgi:hypothetical protein